MGNRSDHRCVRGAGVRLRSAQMNISADLGSGGRLTVRGVDDDGIVTNADVELVDAEGLRWSATVMTQPEIGRLMETWRSSGECQSGPSFEYLISSS
jgi:hypothetical protein